jgi:hypothetical protein
MSESYHKLIDDTDDVDNATLIHVVYSQLLTKEEEKNRYHQIN